MPALAVTLGSFALILVLARLKVPLALAVLAGALAVGLLFGLLPNRDPAPMHRVLAEGVVQPVSVCLVVITALLLGLSNTMRETGQLERIVDLTRAILRRPAIAMGALPALVGLLPMPGGALFSAPMVQAAAGRSETPPGRLSAINYWFRHIWEYWWPLYPGVVMAMGLTGRSLGEFAPTQMPMSLFMIGGGLLLFRRTHSDLHAAAARPPAGTKRRLLRSTASIWLILLIWLAATSALRLLPESLRSDPLVKDLAKYLPLIVALILSLTWTTLAAGLKRGQLRDIWLSKRIFDLAALVLCFMVFQYTLEHLRAPEAIGEELRARRVPLPLVVAMLPFISGFVTGLAIGFVGPSFPIVLGLVTATPGTGSVAPWIALAYGFGHLGQMLSPLHVCQVVSNRFFGTTYAPVYRRILPAAAATASGVVAYFAVLRYVVRM